MISLLVETLSERPCSIQTVYKNGPNPATSALKQLPSGGYLCKFQLVDVAIKKQPTQRQIRILLFLDEPMPTLVEQSTHNSHTRVP